MPVSFISVLMTTGTRFLCHPACLVHPCAHGLQAFSSPRSVNHRAHGHFGDEIRSRKSGEYSEARATPRRGNFFGT